MITNRKSDVRIRIIRVDLVGKVYL